MRFLDFEYDGLTLSDMGYTVCNFSDKEKMNILTGSQITFNTITGQFGEKENLISAKYKEHLECTFQICKKLCNTDIEPLSFDDVRELYRWLNRKQYHKFKPLTDEYIGLYFEGSFNVSCIEINSKIYGAELNFISNRPFALEELKVINIDVVAGNEYNIYSNSDDDGYIYPDEVEITLLNSGDLTVTNLFDNRQTVILNCTSGENISMKYPIITTSDLNHKIQNDFNWNFLRINSEFNNMRNILKFSLNCKIKLIYSPIAKIII